MIELKYLYWIKVFFPNWKLNCTNNNSYNNNDNIIY